MNNEILNMCQEQETIQIPTTLGSMNLELFPACNKQEVHQQDSDEHRAQQSNACGHKAQQPKPEEHPQKQPDYSAFMGEVYSDLLDGAFVGALCAFSRCELPDEQHCETADERTCELPDEGSTLISDASREANYVLNESDWGTRIQSASFYHREDDGPVDEDQPEDCEVAFDEDDEERRKDFAGSHFSLVEGLGYQVPFARLNGLEPSWVVQLGRYSFEAGYIHAKLITDFEVARALSDAVIAAGLSCSEESDPWQWAHCPPEFPCAGRVTVPDDDDFRPRFVSWRPELRYTVEELVNGLKLGPYLTRASRTVLSACLRD